MVIIRVVVAQGKESAGQQRYQLTVQPDQPRVGPVLFFC